MNPQQCDWLDDYLAGELPCDWGPLFEQHLLHCTACRDEVAQWRTLRADLQRASLELEIPPEALFKSIQEKLEPAAALPREPSRARRFAAAVAVCVVAALFLSTIFKKQEPLPKRIDKTVVAAPKQQPVTRVELPDDVIGVPVDIGDPDVTVVWVYPVYRPEEDN